MPIPATLEKPDPQTTMKNKPDDKKLRQHVIDELEFEPSIDSSNISVSVRNGLVKLAGHVPSFPQKLAAERAVWRVQGVVGVTEDIQVLLTVDTEGNDNEIAYRAISVLAWDAFVPANSVRVKVRDGVVTLTGEVKWNYQRLEAEAAVRRLSGVVGVVNQIALAPTTSVVPVEVKRRISEAFKRHAELEADRIRVSVHDRGTVSLEGEVDNRDERDAAEHAAWSAPGVLAVEDNLRIA